MRRVRGVELLERRVGSGPPVVVLHGGPGAHHDYLLPGFDLLASHRSLIYYDQRGGGRSPVSRDVPVGWQEHVADLEALRIAWGLDRLTVVGYSWGGLLALLYALEHPDRLASLALVSPAPCWREARSRFESRFSGRNASPDLVALREALRGSDLRDRDPEAYRRRVFELSVAGYFADPTKASELTPFRVTGRTQQEVWDSLGDYDLRGEVGRLAIRSIVLHGADDPIPQDASEVLARELGAPLEIIAECGHVPFVEAPEAFQTLLHSFLPRAGVADA
jgi:proline iminopeptidase